MWKWVLLTTVTILQLAALAVMTVLPGIMAGYHPMEWDHWHDTANQFLVYTPTVHAAVSLAMISKARQLKQPVPWVAYWSCIQASILAVSLWGIMIYVVIYYG